MQLEKDTIKYQTYNYYLYHSYVSFRLTACESGKRAKDTCENWRSLSVHVQLFYIWKRNVLSNVRGGGGCKNYYVSYKLNYRYKCFIYKSIYEALERIIM